MHQSTSDHIVESSASAPQPNLSVSHFPELFVNFSLPSRSPKMRNADGVKPPCLPCTGNAVTAIVFSR